MSRQGSFKSHTGVQEIKFVMILIQYKPVGAAKAVEKRINCPSRTAFETTKKKRPRTHSLHLIISVSETAAAHASLLFSL